MSTEEKVETTEKNEEKKTFFTEKRLEVITAIFLGLTALLTAWASWIGSLHGGNQATNYAQSNNYSALGNSEWNLASQNYMQDMMLWNDIMSLSLELSFAEDRGDADKVEELSYKLDTIMNDNCTEEFSEAINWAMEQEEYATPFEMEGFVDSYYATAQEYLDESDALLEQGMQDNVCGDKFNLVTVIYSLVLFLLGVVGMFKNLPNRTIVLVVALVAFLVATIFMLTIPMPTGFSFASYFAGN